MIEDVLTADHHVVRTVLGETGGLKEVAEILGWRVQRLSSERHKARNGRGKYQDMPRAVASIAASPLFWLPAWRAYAKVIENRE